MMSTQSLLKLRDLQLSAANGCSQYCDLLLGQECFCFKLDLVP